MKTKKEKIVKGKKESRSNGDKKVSRGGSDTKYRVVKKFKGGVREQCQSVISGDMTLEKIQSLCKKFKVPEKKTRSYVNWLTANGYLKRV